MDCKDDFDVCEQILQSIEAGEFVMVEAPSGFEQRVMTRVYALEEEIAAVRSRKTFSLSDLISVDSLPADFLENLIYAVGIIVSIVLGAGFILVFNQEQIISFFSGSPRLEQYVAFLQLVARYMDSFFFNFMALLESLLDQTVFLLSGFRHFFLFLFAVLVTVQFFMYRRVDKVRA